jgi:hypothetical protein
MSNAIPASIKAGPNTTNTLISKRYLILYGLMLWLTILPVIVFTAIFLELTQNNIFIMVILFPFAIVIGFFIFLFTSFFWAKLFLQMINWKYPPRQGIFPREKSSKDYRYWSLRAVIKKFAIWISHSSPLPWTDTLAFKLFGNKIPFKTALFDAWVDAEFLKVGSNTLIGQGAVIMSSMVTQEFLIIKEVIIGKDCLIGAHTLVSPGTIIGDGVVLGALSSTNMNQELEAGWVYMGTPAQKFKESKFHEDIKFTAEERAKRKEKKLLTAVLGDDQELVVRKGVTVAYQSYRSRHKTKRAKRHEEKALRQLEIAKRQKIIAEVAHNKAQEKMIEKVMKKELKKSEKEESKKNKEEKKESIKNELYE